MRTIGYYVSAPLRAILAPTRLLGGAQRLLGLSLPARVSIMLAVFMVLAAIAAFVAWLLTPVEERTDFRVWLEPWHLLVILALLAVIPLMTYWALKLWLEGDVSKYPDIDRAWQEGLQELARQGLDLANVPLFVVLGADNESAADRLVAASAQPWLVKSVPDGRAALRWYASEKAVLLAATGVGALSQVNRWGPASPAVAAPAPGGLRGTLELGGAGGTFMARPAALEESPGEGMGPPPQPAYGSIQGTLMPSARATLMPGASAAPAPAGHGQAVSRREVEEQLDRLRYLCRLLQRSRHPLCPLNGILVLLPWAGIQGATANKELPEAIRRDLLTIRESSQLCCPVTALVTGLEAEPGFAELVRRVGLDRAKANRFGRGFDHWTAPTAEHLEALTAHACGAFEDWVYDLFRQRDALGKPGNTKLYQLLCRIRSQIHQRLQTVLINGVAADVGERHNAGRAQLFAGCYFAATGESADRQSFVQSVLEKMIQLEEELEWTEQAVRRDRRYTGLANALLMLNGLLLIALGAMAVYRFVS